MTEEKEVVSEDNSEEEKKDEKESDVIRSIWIATKRIRLFQNPVCLNWTIATTKEAERFPRPAITTTPLQILVFSRM